MKRIRINGLMNIVMLVFTAFTIGSCAVEGTSVVYDDIYADDEQIAFEEENYSRREQKQVYRDERFSHQPKRYREPLNQSSDISETDSSTNDEFDMDDYYDYAYTARLHRFHDPAPIYGYYDDYYTNLYWYDRDPLLWGTSIYFGYRWWWPSYGFTWGWGWHPWNHYAWYGDWYGWHHGWYDYSWGWGWYGGPYHGWRHHNWHDPWYFNSHDRNSHFYRPQHDGGKIVRNAPNSNNRPGYRDEPTTAGGTSANVNQRNIVRQSNNQTFADKYNARYASKPLQRNVVSNKSNSTLQKPIDRTRTVNGNNSRMQKPVTRMNNSNMQNNSSRSMNNSSQKRSYTPPVQRQQRNSNVYRSNSNSSRSFSGQSRNSSSSSRSYSSPSRSSSSSRSGSSFSSGSRSSSSSHSSSGSMSRGGRR